MRKNLNPKVKSQKLDLCSLLNNKLHITIKSFLLIIIPIGICLPLTGCYDAIEIDEIGYIMAIGLDKSEPGFIKLTAQIAIPKNIAGSSGGNNSGGSGGKGSNQASTIVTIQTHTISTGLNKINSFISHKLNISHAKAMVFSEELAREGIASYIHEAFRNREFRPNMQILVSRTTAEEYIKSVNPIIESNTFKFYDLNLKSSKYTSMIPESTLNRFYFDMESLDTQPAAILVSVSRFKSEEEINMEAATNKEKNRPYPFEGDFKAGDIPRKSDIKAEILGTAVFTGDKMVGELDGAETTAYLHAIDIFSYSDWSFPDVNNPDKFISLRIRKNRKPKINVKLVDGKPYIDFKMNLEADILAIQSDETYETTKKIGLLETSVKKFIADSTKKTLEKCSRQYRSDIFGFGTKAKYLTFTWQQWEAMDWKNIFQYAQFNVNVDLSIRRTGLIIQTLQLVHSEEK